MKIHNKKLDFHMARRGTEEYNLLWQPKCGSHSESPNNQKKGKDFETMWKPTNQPATPGQPERPSSSTGSTSSSMPTSSPMMSANEPAAVPRPASSTATTSDQATIGKSLVIKGEVTGSESLYIDGRVEGSINLSGNRVTIGRNGVVAANISAREIVVLGKVRGNLTASDRVDIRSDGSLTGDVVAARISIEDGAFFKGGIDIRKAGSAGAKTDSKEEVKSVSSSTPEPAIAARA
jgi:cytoskeletal protein CcmA (bactofilin family)